MEENLVGYLLNCLDPEGKRRVHQRLEKDAAARQRLDQLRQGLRPLELDREIADPPAGLWVSALSRVAEHICRRLPEAPAVTSGQRAGWLRSWRRLDVLVAACLLLCIGMLVFPAIAYFQRSSQQVACMDKMRKFGTSLLVYHDQHEKSFPNPAGEPEPFRVPGVALPILREAGLARDVDLCCPGNRDSKMYVWEDKRLSEVTPGEFNNYAPDLLGRSYSYSMGYWKEGAIQGLDSQYGVVPILSDRPPDDPAGLGAGLNSPNHYGAGQNVLFTDGHVEFITTRQFRGDDLFLNQQGKQEPGVGPYDTVLAPSATKLPPK